MTDQPVEQPVQRKKRGRPKGSQKVRRNISKPTEQVVDTQETQTVNIDISRDQLLAETILEARGYTDEELDTILLGLENQNAHYDWVRSMDEFALPSPLQKLADDGKQAFRWIDTTDQVCMAQITRENFRWTPVNLLSHGKYFKERERRVRFNKHGGIMSGYMLLCWMPGRLYDRWVEIKRRMSSHEPSINKSSKPQGVDTYDPVKEGTAARSADTPATKDHFSGVVYEDEGSHPDSQYDEQGEYI